jgi:HlyD family secretion protein
MTVGRFFIFLGVLFLIALGLYIAYTPHEREIPLVGIVTGTDEIVSPMVTGRLERLLVDEGSSVKAGDLIAEIDPAELVAARDAASANIRMLEARLSQSNTTRSMSDETTSAGVDQASASLTSMRSQLDQARAMLQLNQVTYQRDQGLFQGGAIAAQERDTAEANYLASQANVKALEDQIKALEAQLASAQANRKQVVAQDADVDATRAQLAQAVAQRSQAQTQLGYTKVYAPIDGIVSVRVARQGEVVQAGAPIVTVIDIDHLWVQADVEETYIDSIQFGQTLKVRLPSGDILDGKVFFKGVEGDFATQRDVSRTKRDIKSFAIKVSVPNTDRRLFAGMTATVLLPPPPQAKRSWFGAGAIAVPATL